MLYFFSKYICILHLCIKFRGQRLQSQSPYMSVVHQHPFIYEVVIKFVGVLLNVGGFIWVLRFPPPVKLTII